MLSSVGARAVVAAIGLAAPAWAAAPPTAFKIHVAATAVYRVGFEDLVAAGMDDRPHASSTIGLSCAGRSVPAWLADGGDGTFGPGDHLEFVGTRLAGEFSHFSEFSTSNVYGLDLASSAPARMRAAGRLAAGAGCTAAPALRATALLEHDDLRMRFSQLGAVREDVWFWTRLTQVDEPPFETPVELDGLDADSAEPVILRAGLRGWSRLPARLRGTLPEHRTELLLDGRVVAAADWGMPDGLEQVLEAQLPASAWRGAERRVALRVPERSAEGDDAALVDVVLLNWIEVDYPRSPVFGPGQARVRVGAEVASGCIGLATAGGDDLAVYGGDGTRIAATVASAGRIELRADAPWPAGTALDVVAGGKLAAPDEIVADTPSGLARSDRQADYLIVAHPSLLESIAPLAEFHRGRGLSVALVDVTDVYDEFNHGIVHPRAIRDFVRHASVAWRAPAPRFVLLVGDASWDARGTELVDGHYADKVWDGKHGTRLPKNRSTPYAHPGHRNLIPTWAAGTRDGQAASDNWFVAVTGDDELPDLAIGRFPVTEPAEVEAIVRKTIAYGATEPGPWRHRVLWITNEDLPYQHDSDTLAQRVAGRGFDSRRIYPAPGEPSNAGHRAALRGALDEGQLLVHFIGHGGRYIWRTGPRDLDKNEDLFTLDDLDALAPNAHLPVVLSLTCYSAPFDHPTADSIGEKFLRLEGRGAVAVIAASWRNAPSLVMSRALIDELTTRPTTVGEALLRAKRALPARDFVEQYNLLGDPALPLALPERR